MVTFTTAILVSNSRFFDVDGLVQDKNVVENDKLHEIDVDDFELCKRKQRSEVVDCAQPFFPHPLEVLNVNTSTKHVFNHLKNCLITINLHMIDPKILGLLLDATVKPM